MYRRTTWTSQQIEESEVAVFPWAFTGELMHKAFVLIQMGHVGKQRLWTWNFVCVTNTVSFADATWVFDGDDVIARRLPLISIDACVSQFVDTDHFSLVVEHAWDIAMRIQCVGASRESLATADSK